MDNETRPLRQLSRWDKLLILFGRCPTCRRRVAHIPLEDVSSWHHQPGGIGRIHGGGGFGAKDGIRTGNITVLKRLKIPHCPACQHTFVRGWIYPASANPTGS